MMIAITLFVVCCFLCNIGSANFIPFNGQHPLNNPRYYFPYRQPYPSNLPIYRPNPRSNPSNLCNYWPRFCCGYLVVEKPGSCPNVSNWLQHQHYFLNYFSLCYSDSECPSHYKCCPGIYDTYKSCALPVPPSSSTPKPEFPPAQFPVEPKPEDGESREETTSNEYPVTRDPNEIDIEVGLRTDQTDKDDDEEEEGEGEEEEEEGKKEEEGEKEEEEEDEEEDKLDSDGNSTENTNKEEEQTTLSNPNYVLPDAEISHETEDNDDNAEEKTGEDDDREIAEDKNEGDEKNEEIYDEENYDYDEEEEDDDYGDD